MRYRMLDGAVFSADTYEELTEKMRQKSFTESLDTAAFMQQTATRAMLQSSTHVRTDCAANFVCDLMAAGLLTEYTDADAVRDADAKKARADRGEVLCEKCGATLAGRRFMQAFACTECGSMQNPPGGNGKEDLTGV